MSEKKHEAPKHAEKQKPTPASEVVKPHEAVGSATEESTHAKPGGTSPQESADKMVPPKSDKDAQDKADEANAAVSQGGKSRMGSGDLGSPLDSEPKQDEPLTEAKHKESLAMRVAETDPAEGVAQLNATGKVELLQVVQWLIGQVGPDLPKLLALHQQFQATENLRDRWEVLKQVGDIIVEDAQSFPGGLGDFHPGSMAMILDDGVRMAPVVESLKAEGLAEAASPGEVINFARKLLPIVLQLIAWLRKR